MISNIDFKNTLSTALARRSSLTEQPKPTTTEQVANQQFSRRGSLPTPLSPTLRWAQIRPQVKTKKEEPKTIFDNWTEINQIVSSYQSSTAGKLAAISTIHFKTALNGIYFNKKESDQLVIGKAAAQLHTDIEQLELSDQDLLKIRKRFSEILTQIDALLEQDPV
jgi:hypothetical protein